MAQKFIAYYRVSTEKQAQSGLGIEAQKRAVAEFVAREGGEIVAEYMEAQSGKFENTANRVEFAAAIEATKKARGVLIVAKLDRLARSCSVLEKLQAEGVAFRVADNPQANELTLGLLMVIAKNERDLCSQRTRAALAEKKAQGAKLGAAREGAHRFTAESAQAAREAHTEKAKQSKANRQAWGVACAKLDGGASLRSVAACLNEIDLPTPRGGRWSAKQVADLARLMGGE